MTKIGPAAAPKNLKRRRDYGCKTGENRYIGGQGVPAQCRRCAFARFKENMAVRSLFLLDVLRDLSERRRGQARSLFWRQGPPAVSGRPSCPRLQVPAPGLMRIACTDGEDRFGAVRPATGSNLESPVRLASAPGGRISAVPSCRRLLSARSGWRSQPAAPACERGPPPGKSLQSIERLRRSS